ncbi:MAG: protein-glutamate O-methyltransferase CheR [Desulfatitalea sp.]|nr:protein-glutamate O-methyltransferase CheR [Desulfatitalea sp.]NNK00340.1 protein-glutamate O-methyltransferase CheR [Desulfatitalea sp.]
MSISRPGHQDNKKDATLSTSRIAVKPFPAIRKRITINSTEIQLFARYINDLTGIHIEPSKAYLLETRLGKILEHESCDSFTTFYYKAKADTSKIIEKQIIDAITTNETLFFRDASPFELLKHKILPEVFDKRSNKSVRIWSAACSTGQEVYSIAIILRELLGPVNGTNLKLVGTDISDAAIKQASYGMYNKFEIERGLPRERLQRYFESHGENWKIKDEIRFMTSFNRFNLMGSFAGMGKYDIIFCRNVAIYFTLDDRIKVFNKIADCLEPDGYLIIGSTESLTGVCPRFVPKRHLKSIFYQLR